MHTPAFHFHFNVFSEMLTFLSVTTGSGKGMFELYFSLSCTMSEFSFLFTVSGIFVSFHRLWVAPGRGASVDTDEEDKKHCC